MRAEPSRVVIASRIYAPEPAAASFRLSALAVALADSGAEVDVLTTRAPDGAEAPGHPGVRIRRAPVLRDRAGYVRGYLQYLSFDVPLFFRLLFVRRPDVVVLEPPPTTAFVVRMVCALRRIPYVYYAADIWGDAAANATSSSLVLRAVRGVERGALRAAATVLSVSDGVTHRLRQLGVERIVTIGNGVASPDFTLDGPAQQLDGPFFVYAGTASEVHGATIFVRAFTAVHAVRSDARLVFIGQGADRAELEAAAGALPDGTVRFLPRLAPAEVAGWLRGAVAALASVRPGVGYDFAFPTKLYAAVACGTPVIFTGAGPGAEFVSDAVLGEAVAYDDDAVAAAMLRVLAAPADAARRTAIAAYSGDRTDPAASAAEAVVAAIPRPRSR